jgi:hypothetical protein
MIPIPTPVHCFTLRGALGLPIEMRQGGAGLRRISAVEIDYYKVD